MVRTDWLSRRPLSQSDRRKVDSASRCVVSLNFLVYQEQKIDIGVGKQFAPAVTTHGKQRHAVGERRREMRSVRVRDDFVDERTAAETAEAALPLIRN